uniref:Uncharacterized protein n=1 Tax=Rhizophora mucronata TaxID=61149 RepID=A0A2P2NEG8_RHIMU
MIVHSNVLLISQCKTSSTVENIIKSLRQLKRVIQQQKACLTSCYN